MKEPPSPPRVIISQNCRGLKSANRLDHCISGLSKRNADIIMLQEHGLHLEDGSRLRRICRRYGYLSFAAFLPATRTHGGTAVLVKWSAFGLGPNSTLPFRPFLNAGAVSVQIPAQGNEQPLSYASVYVPVHPPARKVFIRNLKAAHFITRRMVVGTDRNTVADVSTDIRYPKGMRHSTLTRTLGCGTG